MTLRTLAILLSLSAAYSNTAHAMNSDQEDHLAALLKQRQATIAKGHEIQAAQAQLRLDGKKRMEEIEEADRKRTAANDRLMDESSILMHAMLSGTVSLEETERRLSELEEKFKL